MAENILACRPGSYGKFRDGAYKHLASIGVTCVEIPVPEDVDAELARLGELGLSVTSVQADCALDAEDAVERFTPQIDATVKLGAKLMFVSANTRGTDRSVCYDRLRLMADAAAGQDVTIVLETHPDLITNGDVAAETMKGVDHLNLRVNWDTANVYYYNEGIDGIEEMTKVIDHIAAVHLKDTNGGYKTWHFPALGDGIVDFREVFRLMNERGFHGPFTMEIEGIRGEQLDRAQTEARISRSVDHLRSIGVIESI